MQRFITASLCKAERFSKARENTEKLFRKEKGRANALPSSHPPAQNKTKARTMCTSPVKTDNRKRQPPMVELKHCYRRFCYAKEIYIYQRF